MNETYKHTFVVLAYKESEYLEECILSLLNQSEKSEIIISTSTPNNYIRSIAQKYRIPLKIREGIPTIAKDWTFAYSQATTQYLTLAHQDDTYLANYTSLLFSKVVENNPIIAFCNYYELKNNEVVKSNALLNIKRGLLLFLGPNYVGRWYVNKWLTLAFGCPICCPSVMFNKQKIGDWEFDDRFKVNLDWNSWLRFAKMNGKFVYQSDALMLHRIHKESTTTKNIGEDIRRNEDIEIFTQLWGKWIGKAISIFYARSYDSNVTDH